MDLNIKLHGLKYNFIKVQGYFAKISGSPRISKLIELFFYRERRRPGLRAGGPSSRGPGAPVHKPHKMMAVDLESYDSNKKIEGVFL
jgi:hypothetical protein